MEGSIQPYALVAIRLGGLGSIDFDFPCPPTLCASVAPVVRMREGSTAHEGLPVALSTRLSLPGSTRLVARKSLQWANT